MVRRKKTHEEFIKEIKEKYHGEYSVLGEYVNAITRVKIRHNKCGYEWNVIPNNLLQGHKCPKCIGNEKKKTHEEFVEQLNKIHGENVYIPLEKYKGANTKILVKHNCEKCNYHEWEITPHNSLNKYGCPVCSGREAKLGINTIWDTDRWMCDLGISEEDAKKYSKCSNKKIIVKCPDCGKEKKMNLNTIYTYKSIFCSCGDGKSYPEKFVMNVLEQLNLKFETEYSPKWIGRKRFDFYIKDNNCIIETHGIQHYNSDFNRMGSRTLEEEQINDKYKKETALKNDIKYYIELDCRESNMDYIKNSILNSELAELFDLSNIDWNKCAEFANKNIVKEVCDYWNNKKEDETTVSLGVLLNLGKTTIARYLKKGTKLGWCNYDPKEEMRKSVSKNGKNNGKKVEIFKNGKSLGVFESCHVLSRQSEELFGVKFLSQGISKSCNKQKLYKAYQFKYIEDNEVLKIA